MVEAAHRFEVALDQDALLADHRDSVDDGGKRVEIVGYHDHGQAQSVSEVGDQRVERGGGDRVEPRRRLVEEEDLRIERQRARERRALDHAAGQLGGIFVAVGRLAGRPARS